MNDRIDGDQKASLAAPQHSINERLTQILMPRLAAARDAFLQSNRCFVHYTTGANAQSILQTRTMWMRSTVCMNDYSEVQHGHSLLLSAFHGNNGALRSRFIAALNAVHDGIAEVALNRFDEYIHANMYRVFVTCLSEHDPINHSIGRLSMWRAYGASEAPVALVLNKKGFFTESDSANLFLSPVAYMGDTEAVQLIDDCRQYRKQPRFLCEPPSRNCNAFHLYNAVGQLCLR